MAAGLTPSIIVLALGAGALGFPDALRLLLRDVAGRSPPLDLAICAFVMLVLTAYALGAIMLASFVRKAGPGAGARGTPRARRTDPFARLTLAVSLGAAGLVFACLIAEPGARGLALLRRRILTLTSAGAVFACTAWRRPLLLRGAAPASTLSVTPQPAAAFLLLVVVVSGGFYARRGGSLVGVSVAFAAAVVGASMALSRFKRNAADAGGRAAPTTTQRQRFESNGAAY